MEIYIGNLPRQINSSDLKKVVNAVLLPNNFRELVQQLVNKKDRVTFSEIDVLENRLGDDTTRFAHAVIMPDSAARRLLQRMDHLSYQGKSLRVREYTPREASNERRRKAGKNLFAVKIYNRRARDRRLQNGN